ncbi:hypothetical protein E8E11_000196 [Didymella keratinophila]|nr:hypothetical protein E8E11_000196 [Didymella keratinophila]
MADVNFSCPAGGKWYSCPLTSKSKFVGCCQTEADPCSTGCAAGALQPAAYNGTYHEKFPDASCADPALFYTCGLNPDGKDTFWGCCKSNPCANGAVCPSGSLDGAYIGKPEQVAFYVSSELVSSASTSPTSTASPTSTSSSNHGGSSNGAVIGGAVGGALGALLVVGLVVFFLWRKRRNAKTARGGVNVEVASPMMSDPKAFDPHSPNMAAQSPPPTYSATNGDYYQSMAPQGKANPYAQSPYAQGQWAHNADGPQEMEADVGPSNRYSELPAEIERPTTHHRYSELSTGPSCRVSPNHSPKASQSKNESMPPMPQGLGVVTEDAPTKKLSMSRD